MSYSYYPHTGEIIRDSDGKTVAPCLSDQDPDFLEYNAWANEGNFPREVPKGFDVIELSKGYTIAIQNHLDTVVTARNYDGILSLCSYATSKNARFAAEGQAGVEWRDAVWDYAYSYLADVMAGRKNIISVDELIAQLPTIVW